MSGGCHSSLRNRGFLNHNSSCSTYRSYDKFRIERPPKSGKTCRSDKTVHWRSTQKFFPNQGGWEVSHWITLPIWLFPHSCLGTWGLCSRPGRSGETTSLPLPCERLRFKSHQNLSGQRVSLSVPPENRGQDFWQFLRKLHFLQFLIVYFAFIFASFNVFFSHH